MIPRSQIQTFHDIIDVLAQGQAETGFLIGPETGTTVTYGQLQQESIHLSGMLAAAGLESGDKIAFLMDNGLLTAQVFLGAVYGGYVAVPLNVRAGAMQLSYMLDHCDARVVFVGEQYTGLLGEALEGVRRDIRVILSSVDGPMPAFEKAASDFVPRRPAADDEALLMYSSGSTGKPKAAIHTHSTLLAAAQNIIDVHNLTATDRSLLVLPLYHINAEAVTLLPTLLTGGSVVIPHLFAVSKFWDWVDELHVTWSAMVPTIVSALVEWDDPGKDRREAALGRIRFFRSSSAPLSPALHRQFLDKFNLPLLQAMGSTEGGNVFSNPLPPAMNKIGSPGLPTGFEVRIVDRQEADVIPGEAGEVLIRGAALMKGYYKDPEGTAAVVDCDGWLHTGDLARRDEDGYFFVVGRSKELIIKGGVNIAPRQIDEVLELHPAVLEAAAVGVPDRYFGEDAVAFAVLRPGASAQENELLAFCETRLGHFKTPSWIHFLKELPKGPSGKVQRLKLLDPAVLSAVAITNQAGVDGKALADGGANGAYAPPPLSLIEQTIAAAWAQVLGVPSVDLHANFFALGGHSLLAIQCLSKLREKLPTVLSINDFFENITVFEQAELVRRRLRPASGAGGDEPAGLAASWEQSLLAQFVPPPSEETIPRRDPSLPCPLSPAQERLWFLEQLNSGVPVYNEAEAARLKGELNVDALEAAFNMVIARHESLRSTIGVIDGQPYALIHECWPVRMERVDLSALPPTEREAEAERWRIERTRVPYDLESEPGIRVALLRLSAREHLVILMMHHIHCDWSSEGIIWRELSVCYRALTKGEAASLPALPITYGDYAAWQQHRLANFDFAEDLAYWEEQLRGAPALLDLPADRVRPPAMSHRGMRVGWNLDTALVEKLRNLSQKEKVSLFTIFAAALNALLYRYTGSDDILLGIPLADRDLKDLQSVIGFLLHIHVLRTRLAGDTTFHELLSSVQKNVLDLYTHRSAPLDQIVRNLGQERNPAHTPLFQVMLNWRDRDQEFSFIGLDELAVESMMAHSNTSKFDLTFFATDGMDEIRLELEYNADLFDKERIERMLGHYETLLEGVARDPVARVADLPLLTAREREQMADWNRTEPRHPSDKCIHELFEEQAARSPDAVAVVFGDEQISYAELNRRANRLAHYLRGLGVGPDARVAICTERGFETLVALLAVLKAGGAYVPLDPVYPVERLRFMIEDSVPVALLTQDHLQGLFSGIGEKLPVLDLTAATSAWYSQPEANIDPKAIGLQPSHLAYIIYTSGSTGQPKGVMVEHQNVVRLFTSTDEWFHFGADDVWTLFHSYAFDFSVWEIWGALLYGGRLVVVPTDAARSPDDFYKLIRQQKVTVLNQTPSAFRQLISAQANSRDFHCLRYVVFGGEALDVTSLKPWYEQNQKQRTQLINMYGITETTVHVTYRPLEQGDTERHGASPIGRTIPDLRAYILDIHGQPMPVGVAGELYIGGAGVARGYLNRPELTGERFLADPFSSEPGARIYRTGDLARWLADGNIEYLGRNDFQVKLRGFRIELGEIEAALEQHADISQCVVLAQGDDSASRRLVAYVVPTDPRAVPSVEALRGALKQRLPDYMIPAAFAVVGKMPLTPNGKVDRKKLALTEFSAIQSQSAVDDPRDSVEASLVEIWERVLKTHPIGIRSNFFELGGYSFMVIRLFAQINKVFNRSLPIATIFKYPTIEELAALIRGKTINNSSLVPIRPLGAKEPLFIVHSYLTYERFRQVIDADRPLYGLHEREDDAKHLDTVEARVAEYVRQIREIQAEGPYYLIAWCANSPLAVEMARSLHKSGARIGMLGLIDGATPSYVPQRSRERSKVRLIDCPGKWIQYHRERRARFAHIGTIGYFLRALRGSVCERARRLVLRNWRPIFRLLQRLGVPGPAFLHNLPSLKIEHLEPYDGRITLFRPLETSQECSDPALGWRSVALGGVDIVWTPGDHESMFADGNVERFGDLVDKVLAGEGEDAVTGDARPMSAVEQAELLHPASRYLAEEKTVLR